MRTILATLAITFAVVATEMVRMLLGKLFVNPPRLFTLAHWGEANWGNQWLLLAGVATSTYFCITLPLKVWTDCVKCPKNENCDEIAMVLELEDVPAAVGPIATPTPSGVSIPVLDHLED